MRQVLLLQVRSPMKKSPLPVNSRRQLQVPHRQAQIQPWILWCSVSWKQANRNMTPPDESKPHTMSVTLIWIEENPEWSNTNLNMKWISTYVRTLQRAQILKGKVIAMLSTFFLKILLLSKGLATWILTLDSRKKEFCFWIFIHEKY